MLFAPPGRPLRPRSGDELLGLLREHRRDYDEWKRLLGRTARTPEVVVLGDRVELDLAVDAFW